MATLTINHVHCLETTDGSGADDLYINIDGNRVFGVQQIDSDEDPDVNVSRNFATKTKVSLWEYDSVSADDLIGSFFAHSSQAGEGEHAQALTGDGSRYDVYYTVTS
ncbi:hypothetical protein ACTMTU_18360 [Streptomyces sp. OZ13]|jgi:hypothetical protein|uniref:hypothetical protein n=1 Tax=Streptomyces sp. OZ13 TaxID=3452210 RepID=UPI003F8C27F3